MRLRLLKFCLYDLQTSSYSKTYTCKKFYSTVSLCRVKKRRKRMLFTQKLWQYIARFSRLSNMVTTSDLYYKHITTVNGDSRAVRMTLQAVASSTIFILMTL